MNSTSLDAFVSSGRKSRRWFGRLTRLSGGPGDWRKNEVMTRRLATRYSRTSGTLLNTSTKAPDAPVVTATDDRALALSRWLAGGITRVGAAQKPRLEQMGIHVIDGSHEGWGVINHDLFLSNERIREVIRHAVDSPTGA